MTIRDENEQIEYDLEGNIPRKVGAIVAGLDIGTTKVCCIIGEMTNEGIDIIGIGTTLSKGVKRGEIVNIGATVDAIQKAVGQAEIQAGCSVDRVYVGIAGNHIKGFNSPGILALNGREITQQDINDVIRAASTIKVSGNQLIVHVLPQEYMVDDNTGIQDALGMSGVRLVTNVHIVTADETAVQNLHACCKKAGLQVAEIVLESIASARSVMNHDEMEMGVALIDIGGGTTDVAIFCDGTIRYTHEIGLGGHNLTSDLSVGLRTTLHDAEQLKEEYGRCIPNSVKSNCVVEVPDIGEREPQTVTQRILVEILEARIVEILDMVNGKLVESGLKNKINGGVVITGGTALLADLVDLAEQIFDLPVRIGYPVNVKGRVEDIYTPRYTTGAGLALYGWEQEQKEEREEPSVFTRARDMLKKMI